MSSASFRDQPWKSPARTENCYTRLKSKPVESLTFEWTAIRSCPTVRGRPPYRRLTVPGTLVRTRSGVGMSDPGVWSCPAIAGSATESRERLVLLVDIWCPRDPMTSDSNRETVVAAEARFVTEFATHVSPSFGNCPLCELTPSTVAGSATRHRPMSPRIHERRSRFRSCAASSTASHLR